MSENPRIRVLGTELLSHAWARLERVEFDYQRQNGVWQRHVREIYNRGNGAAVLLYNLESRSVVLIRQFRYPAFLDDGDGFLIEVPAGVLEQNNPEATVRAEAEQETGYRVGSVKKLFSAYVSPGSVTEQIHYFIAPFSANDIVGSGGGLADEGEEIEVLDIPFEQATGWIETGRIRDAKTIVLLQYAAIHLF